MKKAPSFSRFVLVFLVLCTLPGLPGCRPADPPQVELSTCMLGEIEAQCGALGVYENRQSRAGRKIDIHFAVIKAPSAGSKPDPIFYFAGGPGGSAIDDAPYAVQVLGDALIDRDLVLIDQRGTGRSNLLTCPRTVSSFSGMPVENKQPVSELQDCFSRLDADPSSYTTAWSVDDFDDVRAALGYEQINLYGESYGPTAEQVYLQRHGDHVRSVIMEGSSLLDVPMFERLPVSIQKAFDAVAARCEVDAACRKKIPDLHEELNEVLARVDQEPVSLGFPDPSTQRPAVITRELMVSGLYSMLHDTDKAVLIPRLVHQAFLGDWGEIAQAVRQAFSPDAPAPVWKVMNLVILCSEDWARMREKETEQFAAKSFVRYSEARSLVVPEEICAVVPQPAPSALYKAEFTSSVPVLIVSNGADPSDPPENVSGAENHYSSVIRLVAPGQGHGWTGFACRSKIYTSFIDNPSSRSLDSSCLALQPLPALAPVP